LADEPTYAVYYRMYMDSAPLLPRTPASAHTPHLGRIRATAVPPPHTAGALRRCITKAEGLDAATAQRCDVLGDPAAAAAVPMAPSARVAILADDELGLRLGAAPERAVVLAYSTAPAVRPAAVSANPKYNKTIVGMKDCSERVIPLQYA
jgi:hypothetical protein